MGIFDIFKSKKEGVHTTDIKLSYPGHYSGEFYNTVGTMEAHYKNDILHGPFKCYDEDNVLIQEGKYLMGNLFGEIVGYHLNGDIKYKRNYNEFGNSIGKELRYQRGNKLVESGYYCNCCEGGLQQQHGVWKEYDNEGRVIIEGNFDHGHKDGLFISYKYKGSTKKPIKDYSILYGYDPNASNWQLSERVLEKKVYLSNGKIKNVKKLTEKIGDDVMDYRYISDVNFDNLGRYIANGN
ncbi:MAG: hypothetical protein HN636_04185 [Cryomorphaceae bacterium]|jgi:antitoxin component YwqK of YwqJK toxin-antitoxin module|nr:hypothetical protein [Candidatus Neomarinimicrobiota bacterium]MBT5772197.1 hypothetical protein [Flavobacteriaceae bacterium]MBT6689130.1 hypothetical protein [Flavobacteriaceae bacterium]MBT7433969.1 hypothetical protein [Candidatus Neomarinimicrobiota bacterium]MBT7683639.1 hypothetical protein [Cryomorphaceae bacterium]